ncbi:hypothetical protein NP233_g9641 [Leucocoprinus birnbaumii]|uniref:SIN1-type PH domain-containing protein n=1 Tax=Leucocoprinus birnbaumii TaxID=56174 RepID=A0AAD5YSN9_9AGAR|nr:hypothetical protein NP233_g9641 [Leucocoprinus birnbaumii]
MQSSESQRKVSQASTVRRAHISESESSESDVAMGRSLATASQRRRPGPSRPRNHISPFKPAFTLLATDNQLPEGNDHSQSLSGSLAPSSSMNSVTSRSLHVTTRRNASRRNAIQSSGSISSFHSISSISHGHPDKAHSAISGLESLPEASTSGNLAKGQDPGIVASSSNASLLGNTSSGVNRRSLRRAVESAIPLEARRSYTVFQRKMFRLKRQERMLLLDRQWVHVFPPSTKSLNVMFDTRKSVSYHVRLLATAEVKSGGRSSIVTISFKEGCKGRLKKYNLKAVNRSIADIIIQINEYQFGPTAVNALFVLTSDPMNEDVFFKFLMPRLLRPHDNCQLNGPGYFSSSTLASPHRAEEKRFDISYSSSSGKICVRVLSVLQLHTFNYASQDIGVD